MKRMLILMAVLGTAFYVHSAVVDLKDVGDLEVTALDSATDYTNTGDELRTLTVKLSSATTYSGKLSGNLKLVYESGGKELTLGGDNSYTGGTEIRKGRITILTSTALGEGAIDITAGNAVSSAGSIAFGAEDLTLANAITVSGVNPGEKRDMCCTFYSTMKKSTVSGKITVTGGGVSIDTLYSDANYNVVFAFTGGIDATGKVVNAAGNKKSTVKFDCDVSCFYFNGWHHSYVVLELSSNHTFDIKCMRCKYTNITVAGTLCPDTTFYWNGNQAEDGRNLIFIKKDQVINCISGTVYTTAVGSNISGDNGKTLTLKAQASADAWVKFATGNTSDGAGTVAPINLVYDALSDDYVQSFHARASRLSGTITVKRGTVKVTDGASFKDVPTIDVQGGSFVLDSIAENALAGLTSLSVGDGAKFLLDDATVNPIVKPMKLMFTGDAEFHLPEGNLLEITELWVDGARQAGGFYSTEAGEATKALSNITGGGKISVPHWPGEPLEIVEATWTDGGADDGFATAGNWSKPVCTTDESLLATFASAGEKADLSATAWINGMVFDLADGLSGFTFTALNDSAVLNVGFGGVTAAERASVDTHRYTFDVPVRTGGPQTWALRTNDVAVFRRPLTSINNAAHMHFDGEPGSVVAFDKASTEFEAHMTFTNTCVQVGAPTAPFGADGKTVDFIAADNAATSSKRPFLRITNSCELTSPVWFGGNALMYALTVDANTTNTLKKVSYKFMATKNWTAYTYAGPNSYTVFAEGSDSGSVVTYFCGTNEPGEKPVFEFLKAAGNGAHVYFKDIHMIARAGGWTGYAFNLSNTYFDAYADTVFALTEHVAHETIINAGSTFDIHGTTQKICRGRGAGTIVGEEGSRVLYWTTNDVKTCETVYAGAVSFEMLKGKINLTGKSPSTGTFSVTNGIATLSAAASWTNAPSVTVSGKGTLNVSSSGNFGPKAAWHVGGDGIVNLASGVRAKAAALYLNDSETPAPDGVYGSAEAAAMRPGVIADSHFTGPGVLRVGDLGMSIYIR